MKKKKLVKICDIRIIIYSWLQLYAVLKETFESCKDPIWIPSPRVKRILEQRAQYNEFVESGLEN